MSDLYSELLVKKQQTGKDKAVKFGLIGLSVLLILGGLVMWPLLIAGIVLGIITLTQKYEGKGMAIAGIITGGVGLLLFLIVLLVAGTTDAFTTLIDALNEY